MVAFGGAFAVPPLIAGVEAVEKPYFDEGSISETIRAAKKENPGEKVETEHGTARPTSRALTEGYYAEPTSNVFYRPLDTRSRLQ